jgi:hypothetical protein
LARHRFPFAVEIVDYSTLLLLLLRSQTVAFAGKRPSASSF